MSQLVGNTRYKLPSKKRRANGSEKKERKESSMNRVNNSLDNLILPELKNKQTFKMYQDQV